MNVNPQRRSNPAICFLPPALGACCLFGTFMAAFLVKDKIAERVRERREAANFSRNFDLASVKPDYELESITQRIRFKDSEISMAEAASRGEKVLREAEESLNKKSNGRKISPAPANSAPETGAKIEKLKEERAQLVAKRDALLEKRRTKNTRSRSWGDWFDEFNLKILLTALPLVGLSLWLVPQTFWLKLPARNPLSLTDFERRCVLFVAVAIITSALGFLLFVWFLSITS
ncbi:MAG TPA: hypothetical protein VF599_12920 [Pyrinomonadaceae bacterium]|jgi:hypothetical protein